MRFLHLLLSKYFNFPAMERSLVLVPSRSVTENVLCSVRSDQRNDPQVVLETRAEGRSCPQHDDDFVAHMLSNGDDANNKGMNERTGAHQRLITR